MTGGLNLRNRECVYTSHLFYMSSRKVNMMACDVLPHSSNIKDGIKQDVDEQITAVDDANCAIWENTRFLRSTLSGTHS